MDTATFGRGRKQAGPDVAKEVMARLSMLERVRKPFESVIDDCIRFTAPDLLLIGQGDSKGKQAAGTVYDGTAISALNLLADGLHGYLVSPSIRWFALTLPIRLMPETWAPGKGSYQFVGDLPEVQEWLELVEEILYAELRASNFYDVMPTVFRHAGSVGTSVCYCDYDAKNDKIVFSVPHFREYYIAQNRFGIVDTIFRRTKMTNRDMAAKFGTDNVRRLLPAFDTMLERGPYEEQTIIHAIYPRADLDPDKLDAKNMPWASVWILEGATSDVLLESGFQSMPGVAWRWTVNSNEWYGRSPAWFALADIRLAQQQALTNLRAAHRASDPPYAMLESIRNRADLSPGGKVYLQRGEEPPVPLNTGLNTLPIGLQYQERSEKAIREHFHVDFFLMLSRAAFEHVEMTATQVIEMQGEKAAVLGTRIGRLQSEFLNPMIDQIYDLLARLGRLPPIPDILYEYMGAKIDINYLGPLAQAQKRLFKTQSINGVLAAILPIVQIKPDVLDNIDLDAMVRELLVANSLPVKCLNTIDEVEAIRQARHAQMMNQQAMQAGLEIAKAAPGLSQPVSPESIIGQLGGTGENVV